MRQIICDRCHVVMSANYDGALTIATYKFLLRTSAQSVTESPLAVQDLCGSCSSQMGQFMMGVETEGVTR